MKVAIHGTVQEAKADELLIDLINRTGESVPHAWYHHNSARFRRVTHAWWKRTADSFEPAQPQSPMESERPSEYSSPLSLFSLAVNRCDITLGDMLIFKLVFR
jgi:hypothetical protein